MQARRRLNPPLPLRSSGPLEESAEIVPPVSLTTVRPPLPMIPLPWIVLLDVGQGQAARVLLDEGVTPTGSVVLEIVSVPPPAKSEVLAVRLI